MIITKAPKIVAIAEKAIIKLKVINTFSKKAFVSDSDNNSAIAKLQKTPIASEPVKSHAKATISKAIIVPPLPTDMSTTFFFTNADLINNKLTKYHGFNDIVDISVFDDTNREIEVSVDVSDLNRVTVDLGRLIVTNTWKIKIEK